MQKQNEWFFLTINYLPMPPCCQGNRGWHYRFWSLKVVKGDDGYRWTEDSSVVTVDSVFKSFLNTHVIQWSNYSNTSEILRKLNDFTSSSSCILLPCLISRLLHNSLIILGLKSGKRFQVYFRSILILKSSRNLGKHYLLEAFRDFYFIYKSTPLNSCWVPWFSRHAIMIFHQRHHFHFCAQMELKSCY